MNMKPPDLLSSSRFSIEIHATRGSAGASAAARAAEILRCALRERGEARAIVASAPSQDELLAGLASAPDIDWGKITIFHMDEYEGLPESHPATFRAYQRRNFLSKITPRVFHGICGESPDLDAECARYAALLAEAPIDLLCMGIGENGHIAFNDPPVADFCDPLDARVVELDEACRRQQVNDGCFPDMESVPARAVTLTCPALMRAAHAVCIVPGPRKAKAVRDALLGPVSEACPASILRAHPDAYVYLDTGSASGLGNLLRSC